MGDKPSRGGGRSDRKASSSEQSGPSRPTDGSDLELPPTLGPIICDWIEDFLVHGPGDIQGTPIELDEEFRGFIWRAYELYPKGHPLAGRRVFRRAVLSRPKGRAKSELAGMIACAEALGPVRFDGWDANGDPVGAPITSPVIRCFATEADQAGNTFDNTLFMMEHGDVYDEYPGIDTGITRINLPDGGSVVSTTSAASSKDGGKDTFDVFDETHLWTSQRLKSLHATVTRNLIKRRLADGWAFETSTMYCPGEGSVAEETHKTAKDMPGVLFDHRQAPEDIDIHDDDQLRAALEHVYGSAAAWTNIDSIIQDEFRNPMKRESETRRYWLNQPWSAEEKFVVPSEWDACFEERIPEDGTQIVIGFDGSYNNDATAIVGSTLGDNPHVFLIAAWERPEWAGEDWRVPRIDVMETIRQAAKRWRLVEATADPYGWAQTLEELADEGLPITEFPQQGARMIPATKRFYDLIVNQEMTHSAGDDDALRRHVLNAVVKTDARGSRLSKDKSAMKIDCAVAAIMAVERASVRAAPAPQVWSIRELMEEMQASQQAQPAMSGVYTPPTRHTY